MNINKITVFFILIFLIISNINLSYASINLTVSPIKEDIIVNPGETISRVAKLTNNTTNSLYIITGKSDFEPSGDNGKPNFLRKSELVFPNQQLSEWINVETKDFNINPGETKSINYTITVPVNATPGGHYGAVFFKNNSSEKSSGTSVGINVDYGIILLINVAGEQKTDIKIEKPIIQQNNGGGFSKIKKDDCPFGDLTSSSFDNKCVDDLKGIINDVTGKKDIINNNLSTESEIIQNNNIAKNNGDKNNDDNFSINFQLPVENKGNTHVKPTGKITLIDEDGNKLKQTGKEFIVDNAGVIVGEKIVDYIPLNDFGGSVIPGFDRKYQNEWKGFAYKKYDQNTAKDIISYFSPSEYYTQQNANNSGFLMFWERINERVKDKKITANFNVAYKDEKGKDIEFNSANDFNIQYKEKYVGLNLYIVIPLLFLIFLFLLFWIIGFKRKRKCPNCGKKVHKDMKICPYCGEKLYKSTRGRKKKEEVIEKVKTNQTKKRVIVKKEIIKNDSEIKPVRKTRIKKVN